MKEMKFIVRSNELIVCKDNIQPTKNATNIVLFDTIGEAMRKAIQVNKKLGKHSFKIYSICNNSK